MGGSAGQDKFVELGYNADGQLAYLQRYAGTSSSGADRGVTTMAYTADGLLTDLKHFADAGDVGGTPFALVHNGYAAGTRLLVQVLTTLRNTSGTAVVNSTTTTLYDAQGRLGSLQYSDTVNSSANSNQVFNYDDQDNRNTDVSYDNRAEDGTDNGAARQYTYDQEGRVTQVITTSQGISYVNGNALPNTITRTEKFSWDWRGRLIQVDATTQSSLFPSTPTRVRTVYQYDGLDRETGRTVTTYQSNLTSIASVQTLEQVNDPTGLAMEVELAGGNALVSRAYFNGTPQTGLIAVDQTQSSGGTATAWTFTDGTGTVLSVGSATGSAGVDPTWTRYNYAFDTYGNIKTQTGTTGILQQISGTIFYQSGTTGIDPSSSRYLSQDGPNGNPYIAGRVPRLCQPCESAPPPLSSEPSVSHRKKRRGEWSH